MDFEFQYPQFLYALAALPLLLLLYGLYLFWKRRTVRRLGDPKLVNLLRKNASPVKAHLKFGLILLAFACGCVALAHPRRADKGSVALRKGIDVVLALDVSNSMLAVETNSSRLQKAKELIAEQMRRAPNDRYALVLFAGTAYVQMPLTFDEGAAQLFLAAASPAVIKAQGTSIADALEKSALAFEAESERFKTIVLITDGETHDETALEKAKDLASKGIMINTVGIGSAGGATILDTATGSAKTDASGNVIVSKLNEPLLQQLAALTNGTYVHLTEVKPAADRLSAQFAQMEKKALGDTSQFTYQSLYLWWVVPMLLLLLAELLLPERKRVRV